MHNLTQLLKNSHHILLLQGPVGGFFMDFSKWLSDKNKVVFKINFNGGDEYYYPYHTPNTFAYRDTVEAFEKKLKQFCLKHKIDSIICFGDTRVYHRMAKKVAYHFNIRFWVFEEGYFRPDYVTFEQDGVNAYSLLPKDPQFYLQQAKKLDLPKPAKKVAKGFLPMAKRAIFYYVAACCRQSSYPYYIHHKEFNLRYYIRLWSKSCIKRFYYYWQDYFFAHKINTGKIQNFYIVTLQVYDDTQVKVHCDYASVVHFLEEVLTSFVLHAPKTLNLVIKHHPMDRGLIDYTCLINQYIDQYPHLKNRIYYIHDVPLPVLLRKGRAMVTINSTSGISALLHEMPVITLGRANYDIEGLTSQQSLAQFWHTPTKPNMLLFDAYQKYHLNTTMINGSFYNRVIFDDEI
ncbi:capsule biosynthesis protein [Pelistega ratti]|uniref:capsule biosynthesis protein n=1 Tax=Pelistega ratti TaxID=2652177 RepID=UPI00135B3C90|nr:capsule biosynthesis protein [Pelistega ratti]